MLRNRSRTTATFEHCPAYIEQLAPSGRVEAHQLNCAAAKPIEPGKSVAFAMRIRVPRNAPLGANGLFWELDPFGSHNPQLHARVAIDALTTLAASRVGAMLPRARAESASRPGRPRSR